MKNGKLNRRLGKLISGLRKTEKKMQEAGRLFQDCTKSFSKGELAVNKLVTELAKAEKSGGGKKAAKKAAKRAAKAAASEPARKAA